MNNLSPDIYRELLSWLKEDDQRALAMVNRMISSQMMKYVRFLWLQGGFGRTPDFEQRFRSYLTSEKLQSLIADPYRQLTLDLPGDLDLKAAGFDDISISCKSLSITAHQLTTSFIHCVKKVQNLTLAFSGFGRPSLAESQVQSLADWMNKSNLGLKQLNIDNYNIINLPVIPSLESLTIIDTLTLNGLNISAYCNLRCLVLSSLSIEDVSSLDGIYELHLLYCNKIQDISCLNHNYKIVIQGCSRIRDYSNSFRYSKIIDIHCPSNSETIQSFDLSKALEAREIYLSGDNCTKDTKPLVLPQCLSLRLVQAENVPSPFISSGHKLIDRDWTNFLSLAHFDRVYSVRLINLSISSLEGLGSGNRVFEVHTCPFITDFSPLRHCDKVTISNCKGFQDIDQVRGVKDFIFSPANVNKLPKDMEGVTCLIFVKVPKKLLSLKFPSTLKKLVFTSVINDLISQLPALLARLPHHIGKIEVTENEKNLQPFIEKAEFPGFIIEFKKGVHFLRSLN